MNQNKMDKPKSGAVESRRPHGRIPTAGEKKRRGLFLMMDLLLLVCILAAVLLLVLAFTPLSLFGTRATPTEIEYTVELSGVDKSFVPLIKKGDLVTDAETGSVLGTIEEIKVREYEKYIEMAQPDPSLDNAYVVRKETNEDLSTLTLTILVTADYYSGEGYKAEECRIAVGREYEMIFQGYTQSGVCLSVRAASGNGEVAE